MPAPDDPGAPGAPDTPGAAPPRPRPRVSPLHLGYGGPRPPGPGKAVPGGNTSPHALVEFRTNSGRIPVATLLEQSCISAPPRPLYQR